jgi:hypothetical protein
MNYNTLIKALSRIEGKLDSLITNSRNLFKGELIIMSQLTDALDFAEAAATEDASADESAKGLLIALSEMVAKLKDGSTDPATVARITALASGIKERAGSLAAAVVANTPAEEGGSAGAIPVDPPLI